MRGALPHIEETCLFVCGEGGHQWIASSVFMGSGVCVLGMQTLANMVTSQPPNLVHACMISATAWSCFAMCVVLKLPFLFAAHFASNHNVELAET